MISIKNSLTRRSLNSVYRSRSSKFQSKRSIPIESNLSSLLLVSIAAIRPTTTLLSSLPRRPTLPLTSYFSQRNLPHSFFFPSTQFN